LLPKQLGVPIVMRWSGAKRESRERINLKGEHAMLGGTTTLYRISRRLRRAWLTRVRWPNLSVGIGFDTQVNVQLSGVGNIRPGKYVRLLTGSIINSQSGEVRIGDNTTICRYAVVDPVGGYIHIGNQSLVGDFCNLYGQGGLTIGNQVQIASGCRLIPKTTDFSDLNALQLGSARGIRIEDAVWLGVNCVVLDGVTIGKGAVVGAGAVVTRCIPPNAIAVGVPARITGFRGEASRIRPSIPMDEAESRTP